MKIEKTKLIKALEAVKAGLASKEMIEQSTSFVFINGNVVTYNDEISISAPVPDLNFEGAINAAELLAFLSKLKTEAIEIELEGQNLIMKSGRAKAGFILKADIKLPFDEIGKISKWKELPDDFPTGIKFVMGSCSRDMSKPILTCVHVSESLIEGTDGYRIANYKLASEMPIPEFLLPANTCMKIIKTVPQMIAEGKGWVHFKTNENAVISCRVFEDKYVDTQPHMKCKGTEISFPANMIEILDRAGVFAKRDYSLDEVVIIKLENNKLSVNSQSDAGWFEEKTRIAFEGEVEFQITPYLLRDILGQTDKAKIDKTKLLFSGANWKYVTLLR